MVKSRNVAGRMIFCIAIITTLFLYVIAKFYHVQIMQHKYLLDKAQKKYMTESKTQGKRGEIYDRNGNLLVGNLPCFSVCADPSLISDESEARELAGFLSPIIEKPEDEIFQKLMTKTKTVKKKDGTIVTVKNQFVVLNNDIHFETGNSLKESLKARGCKSVFLKESFKRFYPKKQLLANILGITKHDQDNYIGDVGGIEQYYNDMMMSQGGKHSYERTRKGAPIAFGLMKNQEVKNGLNFYLTIDEALQTIVEEELDKLYNSMYKPKACYAVLVDPWTGDILAIAQRPTFDPNERKKIKPSEWKNRIAEDPFEPGSIMKPITIAGALDNDIVTPDTIIETGKSRWYYGGASLKDDHYFKDGRGTVSEVLISSSNIGTAKIGVAMGNELVYDNLMKFGFYQKTGIPLEAETKGLLRPTNKWQKMSVTRITIGHEISVTALQMARAYCMIANGGRPLSLNLVDRIEDPTSGKVERIERTLGDSIFKKPDTHKKVTEMMVGVTTKGTGRKAAISGYHTAGKTGTAQKAVNGRYSQYVSSFAGFFPAYNPKFVLVVVADEPDKKKAYYASAVAAPVFKAIAERTLEYMSVPKDFEPEVKKKPAVTKKKTKKPQKKR